MTVLSVVPPLMSLQIVICLCFKQSQTITMCIWWFIQLDVNVTAYCKAWIRASLLSNSAIFRVCSNSLSLSPSINLCIPNRTGKVLQNTPVYKLDYIAFKFLKVSINCCYIHLITHGAHHSVVGCHTTSWSYKLKVWSILYKFSHCQLALCVTAQWQALWK